MPPRKTKVKVRRSWNVKPATLVIADKTKRPHRKRKHKKSTVDFE